MVEREKDQSITLSSYIGKGLIKMERCDTELDFGNRKFQLRYAADFRRIPHARAPRGILAFACTGVPTQVLI